jgi:hypothetical protein
VFPLVVKSATTQCPPQSPGQNASDIPVIDLQDSVWVTVDQRLDNTLSLRDRWPPNQYLRACNRHAQMPPDFTSPVSPHDRITDHYASKLKRLSRAFVSLPALGLHLRAFCESWS